MAIFAGVDLGVSDSVIAVFRGDAAQVIKNNLQEEYTPSAVYEAEVHGQRVTLVGRKARNQLMVDPASVAQEFKLKMGMHDWRFEFPGTGRKASAVELSAEVLRDLANSVKQQLGEDVAGMVIAVPAQFTNPMYEATKQAGKLAGIGQVRLLVEPVAAAWAFRVEAMNIPERGFWLVYDLGGGTFDTALVKLESGVFTVVDCDGDQRLGGEVVQEPVVTKSIEICKRLLAKHNLKPGDVDRLILVGGPTLSPYVRERVRGELGLPVDSTVDPLTAVARGAAIYAKSVQWEESDGAKAEAVVRANLDCLWLTTDCEPTVTGRLEDEAGTKVWTGWHVEVTHLDAGGTADWTSGKVAVNDAGAFVLKVRCDEPDREANGQARENQFRLAVTDPTGREVRTEYPQGIAIRAVVELRIATLPQGIGIATPDGGVLWYFEAGQPLPCERTIPWTTTRALNKGQPCPEVLEFSVVEEGIDRSKAKYNWPIGTLVARVEKAFTDLPEGSQVDVTIAVDENRSITASAYFPTYEAEAQTTFTVGIIPPTRETLTEELETVRRAIGAMEPLRGENEDIHRVLDEICTSGFVEEVEKLAGQSSATNPDAAIKAKELLMRIEKLLDPLMPDLNRLKEWCAQKSRLIENVERCKSVVGVLKLAGRVSAQQETEFNRLVRLFDDACDRRDLEDAMRLSLREVPGFGPLHEFIVLCRGGSRS